MELKDYYFILGVPRTATDRDILRAFRELAKLYHPDRVGPQGTASFQDIVEAYNVLSDPERRRHYNHSLSEHVDVTPPVAPVAAAQAQPEPLIPTPGRYRLHRQPEPLVPEPMSILRDFATISDSLDALRDRFLRNLPGRETPKSERVESLNVEIWLSPYEVLQGVVVPVGIPVFRYCAVCGGAGRNWFSLCRDCGGRGVVETERTVNVRMPPRVREGMIFDMPLRGLGIRNLYLRLHIRVGW